MSDEEKLVKYDAIMNARKKASNKFYDKHIRNGGDDPDRQAKLKKQKTDQSAAYYKANRDELLLKAKEKRDIKRAIKLNLKSTDTV